MIAAVHTVLTGYDVVVALLVVLAVLVLARLLPEIPWVAGTTLFLVGLFGLALTVKW